MKFDTYLFGSIEVGPEKIIRFPSGLVGFEQCTSFTLIHESSDELPQSFTLQSLDDPMLAFQIIDPTALGLNYELTLSDKESELLGNPAPQDVAVMQLLFKKADVAQGAITPALRSPLLINVRDRLGLQKVMERVQTNITLSNLANKL